MVDGSLTVSEVIEKLSNFDPNAKVFFYAIDKEYSGEVVDIREAVEDETPYCKSRDFIRECIKSGDRAVVLSDYEW